MAKKINLPKLNKTILFISTPCYILLSASTAAIAPLSVMAFDAPGSEKNIEPWIFLISMFSLPLFSIASILFSLLFYKQKKYKASLYSLALPGISIIAIILLFIFAA